MSDMEAIQTGRLVLRPFREPDYDDLYEFLSQLRDDEFEGYPDITYENGKEQLKARLGSEEFYAVELKENSKVIGNIYCGNRDYNAKEVGYIVNKRYQRKGYALEVLQAVVYHAFRAGAHRVFAECDPRNEASWRLLESAGFRREAHFRKNIYFWKDEDGKPVWKDTYVYAVTEEEMDRPASNENMTCEGWREIETMQANEYTIRPERREDYRAVENLVRDSFWNVYRPGCSEHLVIHVLRDDPAFVKELDYVMERDGKLIGQNVFMRTVIKADDGRTIPVLTMGPICIAPELKRQGYGKALLDYTLEKATALGYGAVLFEGNIGFYGKSGFDYARKFGIRYHDLPEGEDDSFFLCRELIPGYLDGVTGVYQTPQGYYVDDADVEVFDKDFPPREKLKLPGQLFQ